MFIVLGRNSVILSTLIVITVAATANLWIKDSPSHEDAVTALAIPTTNKTIVIDAGHGGVDPGASRYGIAEKDINLSIALKLQALIESSGGNVILTRDEDEGTHNPDRPSGMRQKKSDLQERKKLAEAENVDVLVSIHVNTFTDPRYCGAQVFYGNNDASKLLGEFTQKAIALTLDDGNNRLSKPIPSHVYLFKGIEIPSILVECGFLSNKEEAERLKTEEHQKSIAWGIYMGLTEFFIL